MSVGLVYRLVAMAELATWTSASRKTTDLAVTPSELDVWVVVVGVLEESSQGFLTVQPNAKNVIDEALVQGGCLVFRCGCQHTFS